MGYTVITMTNKEYAKMVAYNAWVQVSDGGQLFNEETRKAYAYYLEVCYTPDFMFN